MRKRRIFCRMGKVLFATLMTGVLLGAFPEASNATNYPSTRWLPADDSNYTSSNRESTYDITYIVIHVSEGSYQGTKSWFQNPDSNVSAHYVISKSGEITAMVRDEDIAWHAGNWNYNCHTIGIEHEGYVNDPNSFTEAMYQASADLVRWLAQKYNIQLVRPSGVAPARPINSSGIIGHNQVPDPDNPSWGGGINRRTDPGPHWDWDYYMQLVTQTSGAPSPFITSGLRINESPPYYVGQIISARFTITNKGTAPVTFDVLTVGGRDPDNQVADFNWHRNIALNPNESYDYEGSLSLAKVGNYHFFCTYRSPDGSWNTSISTEGLANNTLDISVEARPAIARSPSGFSFTATQGEANPPSQTLSVWNSGSGTLYWQVSDDATWLTLKPANGSSTGDTDFVSVSVSTSGMGVGTYRASITISSAGSTNTPQIVPVDLTVKPTPEATTVNVYPSVKEVSGGAFVISINIAPKLPIAGAQFDLGFDPSFITATEVKEGSLLNQHGASTYFKPGDIDNKIGAIAGVAGVITSPGQTVSSSGTFAVITLSAGQTEGTSPLTLSNVIISDKDGNPLPIIASDGSVIVIPYEDWDVSSDGDVNVLDMIRVGQHWGERGSAGWTREDVNKDGTVNVLDMISIGQHWTG